MTRSSRYWFARVVSVLGFLLVAQLAHADQVCVSHRCGHAVAPQSMFHDCESRRTAPLCIASAQRFAVIASAAAPLFPDAPPSADASRAALGAPATGPVFSVGLGPKASARFYILFGRYLS